MPGVGHGGQDGLDGQLVLAGVGDPAPLGVRGSRRPPPDRRAAGAHGRAHAGHRRPTHSARDLVGVLAEQRRPAVHDPRRAVGQEGGARDRSPTGPSSGCSSSTKWPRAAQVPVVEDLVGGADHPPGQPGALAQPVERLAVVLLGQPLEGPPHLAVVLRPGARGRRRRGPTAARPRPRPRASRACRRRRGAEEVGVERGDLPAVGRRQGRDAGPGGGRRPSTGRSSGATRSCWPSTRGPRRR